MSYANSFKALEPRWILDDFKGSTSHSIWIIAATLLHCLSALLLPCLFHPTGLAYFALIIEISSVDGNAIAYGIQNFKRLRAQARNPDSIHCSVKFQDPAPVYLIASWISWANLSSSISSPKAFSNPLQRQTPLTELVESYPRANRGKVDFMHWAVIIRGTVYELIRVKSGVKLEVTPYGSYVEVNALGVPLQLAWAEELGTTYLTDQEVLSRCQLAVSAIGFYDPLAKNCQAIWADNLLPRITCQCQNQKLLDVPSDVYQGFVQSWMLAGWLAIVASVVMLLRDFGAFPFRTRFCSKANRWTYICFEILKYVTFFDLLKTDASIYRSINKSLVPRFNVLEAKLTSKTNKNTDNAPDTNPNTNATTLKREPSDADLEKVFEQFTNKIVSLGLYGVVSIFLSTIFSYLHRFSSYTAFPILELVLVIITLVQAQRTTALVALPGFPPIRYCQVQEEKEVSRKEHSE